MSEQEVTQGWQEAVRRIEEAKESNATSLDLASLNLTAIPDSLAQIEKLKVLSLRNNQLTIIPEFIAQLVLLEILDLRQNKITVIPDFVGRLTNVNRLDLQENEIATIPASLGRCENLHLLDISGNEIKDIPDFLGQHPGLALLALNRNKITAIPDSRADSATLALMLLAGNLITVIPDSIAKLTNLRMLYLPRNQIAVFPDFITGLKNLEHLDIGDNQITEIPELVGQLTKLENLDLSNNQITSVPGSLAQLAKLSNLDLHGNQMTDFPDSITRLADLKGLDLKKNKITAIPDSLAKLANLQHLDVSNNQIRVVPDSLIQLTNLKDLKLDGNPLPEELFAALKGGVPSFFRYLASTAVRKVYPRTVKLVLLGEPKSGKTTLVEALNGNAQPCDESRLETIGVNVVNIEKSHPADKQPMYLSAWDFAGQHIEHATHQFFLTENAIYLILWNARQGTEAGKRDLWYWLELLKMRVRDPKFLLVATHTELTPPDLNLSEIERSYNGYQGHFPIELSSLKGVSSLETKILELAAASPSLRAGWPSEWLVVRDAIRKVRQGQPHMTPAAFRILMKKNGVTSPEEQTDLAGQLHYLGEILYFQERDELSSLVILNPEWVTELIALVLRSKEVRKHNGILRKEDLKELWKNAKLTPKIREHLIHLMDWFDLTCSTGQRTDMGIVVEALPYSSPDSLKQIELAAGRPQMEMIFRFPSIQRHLPPGIPTWGIARAHRFSKCTPWRDAAAFADGDTKSEALILSSDTAKEVRLRVASDYPPFFFGQLQAILLDTFKRYPGAEPERRLPCPCKPGCPISYPYEIVVKRRQHSWPYVSCEKSGDDVAVETLLSGARRPDTAEGIHALQSDMRRIATEQLRARREGMEKTCPSVFTLVPSQDFKQLETWIESVTKAEELELALYCEHDSGWHPTQHSLYRFTPDQKWFDLVKKGWNKLVSVSKHVGPLAKTVGIASGVPWLEVARLGIEKLPEVSRPSLDTFSEALGQKAQPEFIDIETRYLLEQLIDHLDSQRAAITPKNGGLHPYIIDDGRLLWLCPDHLKRYRGRA